MPAISNRQHLSTATLDAIFGIYAVGLLPGLLLGGRKEHAEEPELPEQETVSLGER